MVSTFRTISLDAMGGDHGPKVVVPAALQILNRHSDLRVIFVGQEHLLKPILEQQGSDLSDRWEVQHASEVVAMDELPSQALRSKKDSSMRVAINLVKEGQAQACVSAGNTGALMATARFVLKTLPGIDRPAIITQFPTQTDKHFWMLDLGANVDSTPEHLLQFAVMGSTLAAAVNDLSNPTVGLLNIGEEEIKGNEVVKKTADLLSKHPAINFTGFVEGNAIFRGAVDVVVCDGFVGNITLKACEGVAQLIGHYTKAAFKENWMTKLAGILTYPILKRLITRIDPRRRNGATLIGLEGVVIKSHGHAGVVAFASAIEEALLEIEKDIPNLIRKNVAATLSHSED